MIASSRLILLIFCLVLGSAAAQEKNRSIRVFIALCDNRTQGIAPVGARIGNGDLPDDNLYWGCTDGFGKYFRKSALWKWQETRSDVSHAILRRATLQHQKAPITLTVEAYRGSTMKNCIDDFESAIRSGKHDLVAFIGHNGLMDAAYPMPAATPSTRTRVIVLCCMSREYFLPRITRMGAEPLLLTEQFMYPGSMVLHDAIESWRVGGSLAQVREAAGKAYARNQKIGVPAATGVFSPPALLLPPKIGN